MREIKFRAWDKNKNVMVYEEKLSCFFIKILEFSNEKGRFIKMQYTGLKDKNGKEIYEGDIMEHKNPKPFKKSVYKVVYSCGGFAIENNDHIEDLNEFLKGSSSAKIIGNIYENPELLEGADNDK